MICTIRVKKCRQGYKVQCEGTDIAHAVWPTIKQAIRYAKMIMWQGDKLEIG